MIGTIRKHQKWLWFVIIAAIIVSFVYFFSPNAKMHTSDAPKIDLGSINGDAITPRQYTDAQKEASIFLFLNYRQWPKGDERMNQMVEDTAYQFILIDTKIKDLKIEVTPEATARMGKQLFGLDPSQSVPKEEFERFVQTELIPNNLTVEDFERFVAHQVGQQHLITLFGMTGTLITPQEAQSFYVRENESIVSEAAIFSASNYVSKVTVTPQAIAEFYTNNQSAYRLPDRVQVNYIKFDTSKFAAEVDKEIATETNLNARLQAIYTQQGADAFKDKDGKPLSTNEAFAQIKTRIRQATALNKASKAATAFLTDLYNAYSDANPYNLGDFAKLAQAKGLTVQTTEPFDQQVGPRGIKSDEFTQRAFRLVDDPTDPSKRSLFSTSPIQTEDGVYVMSLKQIYPSVMQSLEQVRSEVTSSYKRSEAMEMAMNAGATFANALTNGLASGKSFATICAAQRVTPVALPPFSLTTRTIPEISAGDFERIQRVASTLPNGKSSQLVPGEIGGYVLYVENRIAVDPKKMATELPAFTAHLRDQRQSAAFSAWFQKAAKEMNLQKPVRASKM